MPGGLHWQHRKCGQGRGKVPSFGFVDFGLLVAHARGETQWHVGIRLGNSGETCEHMVSMSIDNFEGHYTEEKIGIGGYLKYTYRKRRERETRQL